MMVWIKNKNTSSVIHGTVAFVPFFWSHRTKTAQLFLFYNLVHENIPVDFILHNLISCQKYIYIDFSNNHIAMSPLCMGIKIGCCCKTEHTLFVKVNYYKENTIIYVQV